MRGWLLLAILLACMVLAIILVCYVAPPQPNQEIFNAVLQEVLCDAGIHNSKLYIDVSMGFGTCIMLDGKVVSVFKGDCDLERIREWIEQTVNSLPRNSAEIKNTTEIILNDKLKERCPNLEWRVKVVLDSRGAPIVARILDSNGRMISQYTPTGGFDLSEAIIWLNANSRCLKSKEE